MAADRAFFRHAGSWHLATLRRDPVRHSGHGQEHWLDTLAPVVLYVTGAEYSLGDIAPVLSANATVASGPKSHLEIGFIDVGGDTKRLNAGGYFSSTCEE